MAPSEKPAPGVSAEPTGAAAFVARQNKRAEKREARGRARRRSLMTATAGAALVAVIAGAWTLSGATSAPSGAQVAAPADPKPVQTADAKEAAERERARHEQELAESRKQIEALKKRREELQREVAELAAPLAPSEDERRAEETAPPAEPIATRPPAAAEQAKVDAPPPPLPPVKPAHPPVKVAALPPDEGKSRARANGDAAEIAFSEEREEFSEPRSGRNSGPYRVFIHVRVGDANALARAEALAGRLEAEGVEVAGIRGVPRGVRNDMVRYFYDSDQPAVSTLGRAVEEAAGRGAPLTQDFRNRRVAPRQGTLEIWLSGAV